MSPAQTAARVAKDNMITVPVSVVMSILGVIGYQNVTGPYARPVQQDQEIRNAVIGLEANVSAIVARIIG